MTASRVSCPPVLGKPDWRYLAGLWDGEGAVTATSQRRKRKDGTANVYWQMRLLLCNTDKNLILSLARDYGGTVYHYKRTYRPREKLVHQWLVFNSAECLKILKAMRPFLRYKGPEADCAIEYFSGVYSKSKGTKMTPCEIDRRNQIVEKMRGLEGRRKKDVYASEPMGYRTPEGRKPAEVR